MEGTRQQTLNLEVGVLCNNRCVFCFQRGYRDIPTFPKLIPADELRGRLAWGRENGFDEVTFTGGEPTVRPDFLDLVAHARSIGYDRVAITTNGWRLGRADFFAAAVEAGLTSVGVSIHGPSAEVHDAATGHAGSFAHAVRAVRNAMATRGTPRPVRLNTFTVVSRLNRGRLVELADLLFALGVRLMVLQPAILSKSNVDAAGAVALDLPDLVDEVRGVARRAAARGSKAKLFNLPPCLFADVLDGLEIHQYRQVTLRQDRVLDPRGEHPMEAEGHVRLDACATCALNVMCPGLDVTLLPQEDLAAHFEEAVSAAAPGPGGTAWLAGTDLLTADSLSRVVRAARDRGFDRVAVTLGGSSRAGASAVAAAAGAGAAEVVLVHHARDAGSGDRIVCHAGNDHHLARLARELRDLPAGSRPAVGVLVDAETRGVEFLEGEGRPALEVADALRLAAPEGPSGGRATPAAVARLAAEVARLPRLPDPVVHVPGPNAPATAASLASAAASWPVPVRLDPSAPVVPVALLLPQFTVLNWSVPPHVDAWTGGREGPPLRSRAVRADPITVAMLARAMSVGDRRER